MGVLARSQRPDAAGVLAGTRRLDAAGVFGDPEALTTLEAPTLLYVFLLTVNARMVSRLHLLQHLVYPHGQGLLFSGE